MNTKDWREEYCKKFGLCKEDGMCQCKAELKFITTLIEEVKREQVESIRNEITVIFSGSQEDLEDLLSAPSLTKQTND